MKYLISALFFLAVNIIHAQKIDPPQTPNDWFPQQLKENENGLGYLLLSETEALVPVLIGKSGYGIVKMNDKGNEIWKAELPGPVRAFGKAGENVVVVYENDEKRKTSLTRILFASSNGKKISEENIFENSDNKILRFKFENTMAGDLACILVWKTVESGKFSFNERWPMETIACEIIYFDEAGNKKKTSSLKLPAGAYHFGSTYNKVGELFIVYYSNGQIVTEKYDANLKSLKKLNAPFAVKKIGNAKCLVKPDVSDGQKVLITATVYNSGHQTFLFDFNSGKALYSDYEGIGKSFENSVELMEVKGIQKFRLKTAADLSPVGLMAVGDRIIVLEQLEDIYSVGQNGKTRYVAQGLFVSFYDKNLKKIKTICLARKYEAFLNLARTVGAYHKDGKLFLTVPAIEGIMRYIGILSVVDIKTASFEKVHLLDRGNISTFNPIEGRSTIWFKDHGLISYIIPEGGFLAKSIFKVAFQRVEY